MIGFLAPLFLIGAIAAAIPIILHLIRRREVRRIEFPAMRYLRRAEKRHAKRLRIRHLLLLATRVFIICLLAILAAGPLIGRGGSADHRPTALAIIIDDSQSSTQLLGDRRLLDHYAERVEAALDLVALDDQVAVFSAATADRPMIVQGVAAARAYLEDVQPAAALAHLPETLRRADAWTRTVADGRAREIHLLTDLQRVSIPGRSTSADGAESESPGTGITLFAYAAPGGTQPNGTLGPPTPEFTPLNARRDTRVSVPLVWYGADMPETPVVVRLIAGGNVVTVAEAKFGSTTLLRLPPQDSGWVQGYIEIDNHGLAADDRRYFTWFARPSARVSVLGDVDDFVTHALTALQHGGRLQLVAPSVAEVWVAASGAQLQEGLARGRAVVVLPPSSALELPRLNRRLTQAGLPWRYENVQSSGGAARIADPSPLAGLGGLLVQQWYRLVLTGLSPGDSTLIRLSNGDPWVVRGTTPGGASYLLLASPMTPSASALPVSAGMVPFMDAALGEWVRRGEISEFNLVGGASLRVPSRARNIEHADGSSSAAEGGASFQARRAGNYTVRGDDGVTLAFSVNAPLAEADLERGERASLQEVLPGADWSWIRGDDPGAWADAVFGTRRGRLAWRPLIALLIVFAILESSLAAAGRRRAVSPVAGPLDRHPEQQAAEVS